MSTGWLARASVLLLLQWSCLRKFVWNAKKLVCSVRCSRKPNIHDKREKKQNLMTKPSQYPEKYTRPMRHIHHSTIVWLVSVGMRTYFPRRWTCKCLYLLQLHIFACFARAQSCVSITMLETCKVDTCSERCFMHMFQFLHYYHVIIIWRYHCQIQQNFNDSNTDDSCTTAISKSFLSSLEKSPILHIWVN